MEQNNKPTDADVSEDSNLEDIFDENEKGDTDVADKGELNKFSLDELNNISGRKFETKEDFFKHYDGLKNLVGDQELAKQRKEKAAEEKNDKKPAEDSTAKELAELKKDLAKKDFLLEKPTAKEFIDVVEAYAEKNNITLSEAWESKFKFAETSQNVQKNIISKNRIAPVHSQRISELAKGARTGNEQSQNELIKEVLGDRIPGLK